MDTRVGRNYYCRVQLSPPRIEVDDESVHAQRADSMIDGLVTDDGEECPWRSKVQV